MKKISVRDIGAIAKGIARFNLDKSWEVVND